MTTPAEQPERDEPIESKADDDGTFWELGWEPDDDDFAIELNNQQQRKETWKARH